MMKMISLRDVRDSLKKMQSVISVSETIRVKAKAAVEAMLLYTGTPVKSAG